MAEAENNLREESEKWEERRIVWEAERAQTKERWAEMGTQMESAKEVGHHLKKYWFFRWKETSTSRNQAF